MCYQGCRHENYHGDCTKGKYPKGWICPPDRVYCESCGDVFHEDQVMDDLCHACYDELKENK